MMNELHGKDIWLTPVKSLHYKKNVIRTSPNILQLYFIWLGTKHQCRKTWWENKERRKCRRKEDRNTLHFKLQIDFFCREGENRFGAEFPRKCQRVQSYTGLHGLSWTVYLGEEGFVSKERGAAGKPCLTALCGQTPSECYVAWGWLAGNGGWPAQSVALSDLCLVGPTRTLALCFGFPLGTLPKPALSIKAVKAESREKLLGLRKRR